MELLDLTHEAGGWGVGEGLVGGGDFQGGLLLGQERLSPGLDEVSISSPDAAGIGEASVGLAAAVSRE